MVEWIERQWYSDKPLWLLLPLQPITVLITLLRRAAYRVGLFKAWHAGIPTLVVGNLSVGGTGKTPLTIALVETAKQKGLKVAVVSRGYGRQGTDTHVLGPDSTPEQAGDEPLLIYQRTSIPVAVAAKRKAAVEALLKETKLDLIIADDGLQHYALARDAECVVVDSQRGFGNGWQLPVGPLREPVSRLAQASALVINQRGGDFHYSGALLQSTMALEGQSLVNLKTAEQRPVSDFNQQPVMAIAGIGNPSVFFNALAAKGLNVTPLRFSDHHAFTAQDLPAADNIVIMTEKDAVKLRPYAHENCWYLPVTAKLDDGFSEQLINHAVEQFQTRRDATIG